MFRKCEATFDQSTDLPGLVCEVPLHATPLQLPRIGAGVVIRPHATYHHDRPQAVKRDARSVASLKEQDTWFFSLELVSPVQSAILQAFGLYQTLSQSCPNLRGKGVPQRKSPTLQPRFQKAGRSSKRTRIKLQRKDNCPDHSSSLFFLSQKTRSSKPAL